MHTPNIAELQMSPSTSPPAHPLKLKLHLLVKNATSFPRLTFRAAGLIIINSYPSISEHHRNSDLVQAGQALNIHCMVPSRARISDHFKRAERLSLKTPVRLLKSTFYIHLTVKPVKKCISYLPKSSTIILPDAILLLLASPSVDQNWLHHHCPPPSLSIHAQP
ncbi:hypothetical protein GOP47_0021186 [Adiantum capillus-veneris]|uniref:Uncharacterized protein n=1 Tax=Adiantum capillus-veneris TaxID=13818 RepID=A0A9D4UCG0_ADICA|nr:hypothetical protein GOP47_0021186 [Adiantum capillus-veneris]